jgi:hypothetical protein
MILLKDTLGLLFLDVSTGYMELSGMDYSFSLKE